MSLIRDMQSALSAELGQGFLFAPVVFGMGILLFFQMGAEPRAALVWASFLVGCLSLGLVFRGPEILRPVFWLTALVAFGFAAAAWRSTQVAAPVLNWRYYGPVEGRVIGLDRSASGALRVTLDRVTLARMSPRETPARVRISLYGSYAEQRPSAGARVITTAHLSPPSGPAEPGGFDFQRHAWFTQTGGVGYTRVPLLLAAYPSDAFSFFKLRLALSDKVTQHLNGQTGAFASALMTGDRSGLSQETLRDLRHSNLAHLLAISGLHMGLLVGFVFAALRFGLSLIPALATGSMVKKLASVGGLIAAAGYLGLSGSSVATERAFVMAAVALGAVMLERRAISLRAVALAAMIILLRRPEAITGPGFQMSFAATTALVVVFNALSQRNAGKPPKSFLWNLVSGTVISSAVAGLATLPIAAAHFNNIAQFGLIANLLSVPLMGIWVIPLAVLAICFLPFGLEWMPLRAMGWGLDWILGVAHEVSHWEGAINKVPAPPSWALFALCLGLLALALMATRARFIGLVPICLALFAWVTDERPDVLISDTGVLVGVLKNQGRVLSKDKGSGFVASVWLENDGDARFQKVAAFGWPKDRMIQLGMGQVHAAAGKRGLRAFTGCNAADIVVFSEKFEGAVNCTVFDQTRLRETGSVAVKLLDDGTLDIKTARQMAGRRVWNDKALRKQRFDF